MTRSLLTVALAVAMCGCEADFDRTPQNPDIDINVNRAPDLNPRTDHDIDIKTPNVDIDVHRTPGKLPDVDIDIGQKRDADTKANETPGSDPDPKP